MIVVAGESLIDLLVRPDGTVAAVPGGGPFNTARALARLGVPTSFLGRLSTDDDGRLLARLLEADGVDIAMVSVGPEPTTVARASINRDGSASYRFLTDGTSAPNLTADMLPATLAPDVAAIHVGTLGLVLEPIASTIIELLDNQGTQRLVTIDPNIRQDAIRDPGRTRARILALLARSTIVKASEEDLAWLYPGQDLMTAAGEALAAGPRLVVVTLGAQGAVGITTSLRIQVSAPVVDVVDTIGAGDAFGAALLAWLDEHRLLRPDFSIGPDDLELALTFACKIASLTCASVGAEPPRGLLAD